MRSLNQSKYNCNPLVFPPIVLVFYAKKIAWIALRRRAFLFIVVELYPLFTLACFVYRNTFNHLTTTD